MNVNAANAGREYMVASGFESRPVHSEMKGQEATLANFVAVVCKSNCGECRRNYMGTEGSRVQVPGRETGSSRQSIGSVSPIPCRHSLYDCPGTNAAGTTCRGFESRRLHWYSYRSRSSVGRAVFRPSLSCAAVLGGVAIDDCVMYTRY